MDPKLETGRFFFFLSSRQIQIFDSSELLAQELMERMVIVTHTVSAPEKGALLK